MKGHLVGFSFISENNKDHRKGGLRLARGSETDPGKEFVYPAFRDQKGIIRLRSVWRTANK
jgi:hypothetical protein